MRERECSNSSFLHVWLDRDGNVILRAPETVPMVTSIDPETWDGAFCECGRRRLEAALVQVAAQSKSHVGRPFAYPHPRDL